MIRPTYEQLLAAAESREETSRLIDEYAERAAAGDLRIDT